MRSITNAVRTQVNKGVSQIIRATMVLADGTTTTLEQSSFFGNIAFEWATSQTGAFDVGSAVISSFKFSLNNFDGDFDDTDFAGARILPMIGIPLDDGGTNVSYIQFGTFYFVSHRTLGNVINCEAYDALKFMDEENCTASFPMTAKQFVTYLKNKYSLVLAENSFTNDGTTLPAVSVGMTDRQALVYAMQMTGNFAVINSAGKLHIGWYNTASAYSAPDVFEHNLWTNSLTITGVKVTPYQGSDGNAVSKGTTDYVVEISNNPFIRWDNVEAVANTLYNRLNGMSFRPGSITVLSSPVYEVGDCLSYTDKAGNTSVTPITNIRYSKSLRTTISCDCGEESTNDLRKIATVIGISGTEITYAVSSNGTTPPSSGWQDAEHMPTADEGEYLWTKVSISFTDGTVKNSYSSAYQGVSGISPIVTVEETTTGATISVTDASGETTTAEVKNGKSPNITTSKSGDTTTIYADGVEIGTITDGEEGKSPTITSSKVNGVTTVRADGVVIATINDGSSPVLTATKSGTTTTIYSDGTAIGTIEDGEDGPTGAKGEKGYVHIAWANSANGVTDFSTTVSAGKTYFGSYTDHTEADSTDPTKYNWSLIKGDKGDTGAKGDTGDKGDKGDKGDSATAYSLIVSHAAIAKSVSGSFSPTSITLTAKSQTGTNAYANYSGRFKIEVYNGSSWSTKYTSSSNENTKSYTIPSGTTQVRCSLYLAGGTTTLLDQQTIPVVSDGAAGGDAYTIILDNESHTFAGGTSTAIAGTATVNVYAYKGATAIAPIVTKANISGLPTGMSVQSVTNDSTNKKSTIVFAATTSMVTRSGLVTIPVVVDGKTFNKEFSYSLALQGIKGDTGDKGDKGDTGDKGDKGDKGDAGRNGADHNLLMDVYASSLKKVDGPANRYLSESGNSTTTGEFIAEANLPDPNATHFYRISATQANKNRGLCWYDKANPPILDGSTYRIGCYARASSGSPKMNLRFSNNSANQKFFTVSNADWQWFEYTAIFEDSGNTADNYKHTYFYCDPQAAGDALDMCGFRLERVTDDVLAIKLTADTAKADAATAQSTADDAAALAQAAKDSADGKITTFYQSSTPTAVATGDLWINTTNSQNTLSRWNGTSWVAVDNAKLEQALQTAATAQATADGKIMTFAQNDAPTGTLDTGDLWVDTDDNNRLYRWNGTTWDEVTDKTNLVPNLTPWFDRPFADIYDSTTNPNGYWNSDTLTSALTQLPDGWAHVDVTNSGTSNALLMRAVGRAVNGIVTGGNYTCLVEFRNVVNAAGINSFYTQQANGVQFWGDGSYDGWTIPAAQIVEGAKIYKPMKCVTGPTKAASMRWLMSIASYIKPSQTVSYDFRVSLYEGTYTGPYKPYVDQDLRADVDDAKDAADAAQTAANNAQATANQKKQTFISTPTPPYYEGDAYFKTESGESGSAQWYVCTNTRLTAYGTGESWEDDFEPTSYALESSLQSTKTELLEEDRKIRASVKEQKTYTDGKVTPLETRTSTLEQTTDNLTFDFKREISGLKERTESNENDLSSYQKVFAFTENGLQISEQRDKIQTPSVLQIDNGKISFIVDGQEASYWSGENSMFYVGDIVVGLNKKAQFGNFAWIPRSNGNLSFRWVGSSEDNN